MSDDTDDYAVFNDPNNITVGQGRIIWAKACCGTSGIAHADGWVLPGGRRTQNEILARAAAATLDRMSRKADTQWHAPSGVSA